jgi:hypothetical protein
LGNALAERYLQREDLTDFERGVQAYEEAITASPPNVQAMIRNNLGMNFMDHYHRTEDLAALAQAIRNFEQSIAESHSGRPMLLQVYNNLGNALQERYARTRDPADLSQAIAQWERA